MWDNLGEDVWTGRPTWKRCQHMIHMKSKSRWQILKFIDGSTDKYKVFRDNLTAKQAQALLTLIKEG